MEAIIAPCLTQQVTSRGCSRGFLLCVIYRALHYVSAQYADGYVVGFPFDKEQVSMWLALATYDCTDVEFQQSLGGTPIDVSDPSTYWTHPQQFVTWWKNNVERRKKNSSLKKDAEYRGDDEKLIQRALFCRNAIAISTNVKNFFERNITLNGGQVASVAISIAMPEHMPRPVIPPAVRPYRPLPHTFRSHKKQSTIKPLSSAVTKDRSRASTSRSPLAGGDNVTDNFPDSRSSSRSLLLMEELEVASPHARLCSLSRAFDDDDSDDELDDQIFIPSNTLTTSVFPARGATSLSSLFTVPTPVPSEQQGQAGARTRLPYEGFGAAFEFSGFGESFGEAFGDFGQECANSFVDWCSGTGRLLDADHGGGSAALAVAAEDCWVDTSTAHESPLVAPFPPLDHLCASPSAPLDLGPETAGRGSHTELISGGKARSMDVVVDSDSEDEEGEGLGGDLAQLYAMFRADEGGGGSSSEYAFVDAALPPSTRSCSATAHSLDCMDEWAPQCGAAPSDVFPRPLSSTAPSCEAKSDGGTDCSRIALARTSSREMCLVQFFHFPSTGPDFASNLSASANSRRDPLNLCAEMPGACASAVACKIEGECWGGSISTPSACDVANERADECDDRGGDGKRDKSTGATDTLDWESPASGLTLAAFGRASSATTLSASSSTKSLSSISTDFMNTFSSCRLSTPLSRVPSTSGLWIDTPEPHPFSTSTSTASTSASFSHCSEESTTDSESLGCRDSNIRDDEGSEKAQRHEWVRVTRRCSGDRLGTTPFPLPCTPLLIDHRGDARGQSESMPTQFQGDKAQQDEDGRNGFGRFRAKIALDESHFLIRPICEDEDEGDVTALYSAGRSVNKRKADATPFRVEGADDVDATPWSGVSASASTPLALLDDIDWSHWDEDLDAESNGKDD